MLPSSPAVSPAATSSAATSAITNAAVQSSRIPVLIPIGAAILGGVGLAIGIKFLVDYLSGEEKVVKASKVFGKLGMGNRFNVTDALICDGAPHLMMEFSDEGLVLYKRQTNVTMDEQKSPRTNKDIVGVLIPSATLFVFANGVELFNPDREVPCQVLNWRKDEEESLAIKPVIGMFAKSGAQFEQLQKHVIKIARSQGIELDERASRKHDKPEKSAKAEKPETPAVPQLDQEEFRVIMDLIKNPSAWEKDSAIRMMNSLWDKCSDKLIANCKNGKLSAKDSVIRDLVGQWYPEPKKDDKKKTADKPETADAGKDK